MPKTLLNLSEKNSSPFKSPTLDYREFLCGWGSAFINITFTYPLYKTVFRQVNKRYSCTEKLEGSAIHCRNELTHFQLMNLSIHTDAAWREDIDSIRAASS